MCRARSCQATPRVLVLSVMVTRCGTIFRAGLECRCCVVFSRCVVRTQIRHGRPIVAAVSGEYCFVAVWFWRQNQPPSESANICSFRSTLTEGWSTGLVAYGWEGRQEIYHVACSRFARLADDRRWAKGLDLRCSLVDFGRLPVVFRMGLILMLRRVQP